MRHPPANWMRQKPKLSKREKDILDIANGN